MQWTIEIVSAASIEIDALPIKLRARLEGGRVSPSFATLRRYAEATGTRLTAGLVQADG